MSRILVTGARAPVALHIARLLAAAGHEVVLADCLDAPLARSSRAVARYYRLPPPSVDIDRFGAALRDLIARERPTHIVPTCEEVFYLAWIFEHFGWREANGEPTLFAPSFSTLARSHSKAVFAGDAGRFGLKPPTTRLIASREDLARIRPDAANLVLKPVWSRFATHTLIKPTTDDLDDIAPTPLSPWVAQDLIGGEELCAYAVAHDGVVTALAIYRPKHRAGLGAGIYFEPVEDGDIARDVAAYAAATKWTGQLSFDFRRDGSGRPRVLECNPRATSGVHFFGAGSALPAALLDGGAATPTISGPLMITAAMLLYGLPAALRTGRVVSWASDVARARNAVGWRGDRLAPWAQPRAILELAGIARKAGRSLLEASTYGIEWNGGAIGGAAAEAEFKARAR